MLYITWFCIPPPPTKWSPLVPYLRVFWGLSFRSNVWEYPLRMQWYKQNNHVPYDIPFPTHKPAWKPAFANIFNFFATCLFILLIYLLWTNSLSIPYCLILCKYCLAKCLSLYPVSWTDWPDADLRPGAFSYEHFRKCRLICFSLRARPCNRPVAHEPISPSLLTCHSICK